MKNSRWIGLVLCCILLSGIVVGCTKKDSSGNVVEIVFWQPDLANWQPLYTDLVNNFNKDHPGIKVKMANIPEEGYFEKLNTAFAAGKGPDMWVGWYSIDEYARGYIEPIDEYIQTDGWDMTQYFQPITELRLQGTDGKYYGLPRDVSMAVVLYNKEMFDKQNVAYPKDGWTLDDFRDIARKLTNPTSNTYGTDMVTNEWGFITGAPVIWNMNTDLVSEDGWTVKGYMDSPETIKLFETMQSILKDGSNIPTMLLQTMSGDNAGFTSGMVGMTTGSLWGFNTIKEVDFEWGAVAFPKVSDTADQHVWMDIVNWHMNSKSKHKKETWEFMKYMSSMQVGVEVAKQLTWGPPIKQTWIDSGFEEDEHLGVFFREGLKETKTPVYLRNNKWWDASEPYSTAFANMMDPLDGKQPADVKSSLEAAAAEVQANLDKLKEEEQSK